MFALAAIWCIFASSFSSDTINYNPHNYADGIAHPMPLEMVVENDALEKELSYLPPSVILSPNNLIVEKEADCIVMLLNATEEWSINNIPSWVNSVSPNSGIAGSHAIEVCFDANPDLPYRHVRLEALSSIGEVSEMVLLQKGNGISPEWQVVSTPITHNVLVRDSIDTFVNGEQLCPGDQVGFFYTHNNEEHCGGFIFWTGVSSTFEVHGNTAISPGKNGFEVGEEFLVKIWDDSEQAVVNVDARYLPVGSLSGQVTHTNEFANEGASALDSLENRIDSLSITLFEGWNIISSNVFPLNIEFEQIFTPIQDKVLMLKDADGIPYLPTEGINDLGSWDVEKGYKIKVSESATLSLKGEPILPEIKPIDIKEGWQIIPYYKNEASEIEDELETIVPQVDWVKNGDDNFYIPSNDLNEIVVMAPGQGYFLHANEATTFFYSQNTNLENDNEENTSGPSQALPLDCPITSSYENATIIIRESSDLMLDGMPIPDGSRIIVYTEQNGQSICVGQGLWEGESIAIIVYGETPQSDGMKEGDAYQFRVELPDGCTIKQVEVTYLNDPLFVNADLFEFDGISGIASLHASSMKVQADQISPSCEQGNAGEGLLSFDVPGITPYEYAWSNGQSTLELSEVSAGTYTITVTDASGCQSISQLEIDEVANPQVELGQAIEVCENETVNLNAGQDGTVYQWSNGASSMSIEVTSSGQYFVSVENDFGCETIDSIEVVINSLPSVELGTAQDLCEGELLELNAGNEGETYNWYLDNELITGANTSTLNVNQAGNYAVIVTDVNSCSETDQTEVTFHPLPMVSLGNDLSFCRDAITPIDAGTGASQYEWTYNGNNLPNENEATLTPEFSGIYEVVAYNDFGCTNTGSLQVEIFELPEVDLGEDLQLCEDELAELSVDNINVAFQWLLDGSIIQGASQSSLEVASSGLYTVEIIDGNSCTGSDEIVVDFASLPIVEFADPSLSFCDDENILLEPEPVNGAYQWYLNGQLLTGANATNIEPNQSGLYTLEVSNAANCIGEGSIEVVISEIPSLELGENVSLCPGDTLSIEPGIFDNYLWSNGSVDNSLSFIANTNLSDTITNTFWLQVYNHPDCPVTDTLTAYTLPQAKAEVDQDFFEICEGESIELVATGGSTYQWYPTLGIENALESSTNATPLESILYQVEVSNQCSEIKDTAFVEVFVIDVNAYAVNDTCIARGTRVMLNAFGGISYEWEEAAYAITDLNIPDPTSKPSTTTDYVVHITDENDCIITDTVHVEVVSWVFEAFKQINTMTPNGDGKNDLLEFQGLEKFPYNRLTVFNRWGDVIYEKNDYQTDDERWDGTHEGQPVPAGTYFYVLNIDGQEVRKTLVLIRD